MSRCVRCTIFALSVSIMSGSGLTAMAQADGDKTSQKKSSEQSLAEKLVFDLNSSSSAKRADARNQLLGLGKDAVAALKLATESGDAQTAYSAVRLLGQLRSDEEDDVRSAAQKALEDIAAGPSKGARHAKRELKNESVLPKLEPAAPNQFQMQQSTSISRSSINGNERLTAEDGEQRVTIDKDRDGSIEMRIRPKDKQKKEVVVKADSEAGLKKANPEAWKTYDKYMNQKMAVPGLPPGIQLGNGNFQFKNGGQGFQFQFPNMPNVQLPPGIVPPGFQPPQPPTPLSTKSLRQAKKLVQESKALLKDLGKENNSPEVKKLQTKLNALEKELRKLGTPKNVF